MRVVISHLSSYKKLSENVPFAVLGDDVVLVRHPVLVPAVDRGGVVHAEDVDGLDLEAGRFDLVDDPSEGARRIGAGEDVLVHE